MPGAVNYWTDIDSNQNFTWQIYKTRDTTNVPFQRLHFLLKLLDNERSWFCKYGQWRLENIKWKCIVYHDYFLRVIFIFLVGKTFLVCYRLRKIAIGIIFCCTKRFINRTVGIGLYRSHYHTVKCLDKCSAHTALLLLYLMHIFLLSLLYFFQKIPLRLLIKLPKNVTLLREFIPYF